MPKMFLYIVVTLATLFIIFALAYSKPLNNWLRSSLDYSISLSERFNGRFRSVTSGNLENTVENISMTRSFTGINEAGEYESVPSPRIIFNQDKLIEEFAREIGSNKKNLGVARHSLENLTQDDRDNDLNLSATGTRIVPPIEASGSIKTFKQEGSKDILQSLKSSIQKSNIVPSTRLHTSQIYNLILKESLKENAAQQKTMESEKNEIDGAAVQINEDEPASLLKQDENKSEDTANKFRYFNNEKIFGP